MREDKEVVVVDSKPARYEAALAAGFLCVNGDATDDDVLCRAALPRASILIVSLQSDGDAISVVLSARVLNPDVRIVARANAAHNEEKLRRAGVDHVVNPLEIGAKRLAAFAQQPAVADFVDVVMHGGSREYSLEELVVPQGSPVEPHTGHEIAGWRDRDRDRHSRAAHCPRRVLPRRPAACVDR